MSDRIIVMAVQEVRYWLNFQTTSAQRVNTVFKLNLCSLRRLKKSLNLVSCCRPLGLQILSPEWEQGKFPLISVS